MTDDELFSCELFLQDQKMEAMSFYLLNLPFDINTLDDIFGEMQFQELEAKCYLEINRNAYVLNRMIIINEMWQKLHELDRKQNIE